MTGHETPHRLSTGKQRLSCPHHLRPICLPHHVRGGACVSWMTGSSFILLQFLSHSRWVGTRRVALPYVSSCPPLKTVRTTFMVYGLAPAVSLRDPRSVPSHFASSTRLHPWTACAFAGYLCSGLS